MACFSTPLLLTGVALPTFQRVASDLPPPQIKNYRWRTPVCLHIPCIVLSVKYLSRTGANSRQREGLGLGWRLLSCTLVTIGRDVLRLEPEKPRALCLRSSPALLWYRIPALSLKVYVNAVHVGGLLAINQPLLDRSPQPWAKYSKVAPEQCSIYCGAIVA